MPRVEASRWGEGDEQSRTYLYMMFIWTGKWVIAGGLPETTSSISLSKWLEATRTVAKGNVAKPGKVFGPEMRWSVSRSMFACPIV